MKVRAKSRRFARKRKGCNATIARHAEQRRIERIDEPVPGPSHEQSSSMCEAQTPEMSKNNLTTSFKEIKSVSDEKLKNSSLKKSPVKGRRLTRAISQRAGLSSRKINFLPSGYSLIALENLQTAISQAAICTLCKDPRSRLSLVENVGKKRGLAQMFTLNCSVCSNVTEFCSSRRGEQHVSGPYDINTRSVHASLSGGLGHSGLAKICASFDLPKPCSNKPYNVILKRLSKSAEEIAECKMKEAAERLVEIVKSESPDKIENRPDGKYVTDVSVTVDGTWQRRGHDYKTGVIFVISVRTGEILDYVVKTK